MVGFESAWSFFAHKLLIGETIRSIDIDVECLRATRKVSIATIGVCAIVFEVWIANVGNRRKAKGRKERAWML